MSTILRRALLIAKKLNLLEAEKWIHAELYGYQHTKDVPVPEYRFVLGVLGFRGPFGGWTDVLWGNVPQDIAKKFCTTAIHHSVGELESEIGHPDSTGGVHLSYPPEAVNLLHGFFHNPDSVPALAVSVASMNGIVDSLRTKVLEWAVELEKRGITGEGVDFTEHEKEIAATSPITNIVNYIQEMHSSQIQQATHNSSQSLQSTMTFDPKAFLDFIAKTESLLSSEGLPLTSDERETIKGDLQQMGKTATSNQPSSAVLRGKLLSIKAILEGAIAGAAGNIATSPGAAQLLHGLIHQIQFLLAGMGLS
jgi:hypothetical protein